MALGLFRGIIRLSIRREVSHWCLAAEPSLLRRLRGLGLHFEPAGPLDEHRGLRQICRSEEHTSELQSLMRISYAVFCLKKKKKTNKTTKYRHRAIKREQTHTK